ncbi:hypothetical protein ILYODFUR_001277, partial [Ilyodon furcidens]
MCMSPLFPGPQQCLVSCVLHSFCNRAEQWRLDQTVPGVLLAAWGDASLARHVALQGSSSLSTSQPVQGERKCVHVWVCLCFILTTPNCCSFPPQRQNKHIKAKLCSSLAFTHIT